MIGNEEVVGLTLVNQIPGKDCLSSRLGYGIFRHFDFFL